jgi:hypothetical protein
MKTAKILIAFALGVTVLGIALPAGSVSYVPLPIQEQQVGNVTYISGGVGEAEAAVMRNMAKDYLLEVSFMHKQPGQREEMLADIGVQIVDEQNNKLLDIRTDGPYLLANMPEGNYLIIADHEGDIKQQKISIDIKKHKKVVFWWPTLEQPQVEEISK